MSVPRLLRVPDEFASIGGALDAAMPGDTVAISPGKYVENLLLSAPVALRAAGPRVEISPKDVSIPALTVAASAGTCICQGITFSSDERGDANYKVAIRLLCENLQLLGCAFTGWSIVPDGSLPDEDDWWGDLVASAIHVAPEPIDSHSLTLHDCAFTDCLVALTALARGTTRIAGTRFDRCSAVLHVHDAATALLSGNLFTDCETPISLGPGASVQSTFDTFWGSESLISFGNATSSSVLLSHSLVRSRHLMSLSVGEGLVCPAYPEWNLNMPDIHIAHSSIELGSSRPSFRFARTARSEWSLPSVDVRDHVFLDGYSSISVQSSGSP